MSRTFMFNTFDTGIGLARSGLPASAWDDTQQIAVSGAFVHGDRTTRAEILPANDPVVENGTSEDDTLMGEAGNDTISARRGDDSVTGAAGDDDLNGGQGADTLEGDAGNDLLQGKEGDDSLVGGDDDDVLEGGRGDDTLDGGAGNDTLTGGDRGDLMLGGDGDDSLKGNRGPDTMSGGEGNDTLSGAEGTDSLNGDGGNDSMAGGAQADTLRGGDGDDSMRGNEGADSMEGGTGNDTLIGDRGDDTLYGDDGDDSLGGGQGADFMLGDAGNDTLLGAEGSDFMQGGDGDDSLSGGGGDDFLQGGSGSDTLIGGAGGDYLENTWESESDDVVMRGGEGDDTYAIAYGQGLLDELLDKILAARQPANGEPSVQVEVDLSSEGEDDGDVDTLFLDAVSGFVTTALAQKFEEETGQAVDVTVEYCIDEDIYSTIGTVSQSAEVKFQDAATGDTVASGTVSLFVGGEWIEVVEVDTNKSDSEFNFDFADVDTSIALLYDDIEQAVTFTPLDDPDAPTIITYAGGVPSFPGFWIVGLGSGADVVDFDLDIPIGAFDLDTGDGDDIVEVAGTTAQISLGDGNDSFEGGAGAQEILDGAGQDVVAGGADQDTFLFTADGEEDVLEDWELGEAIYIEGVYDEVEFEPSNVAGQFILNFSASNGQFAPDRLILNTEDLGATEDDILSVLFLTFPEPM